MKRLINIISNLKKISSKKYLTFSQKWRLFFSYIKIVLRRFFDGRISFINTKNFKLLSYNISIDFFSDFYWTFIEVFIDDDYYFKSDKKDPFIVDCGGNIGVTVLFFKFIYPDSKILVFEPIPDNIKLLKKNIEQNNITNVELVEKAVGEKMGELKIYGDRRAATISKGLIDEQNKVSDEYKGKEIVVPVVPLSKYIKDKNVDFFKMDIEGAEGSVFYDLQNTNLVKNIKQLSMEYHRFSFKENKLSGIVNILEKNNFDIVFSGDYTNLTNMPIRKYYNFMLSAKQRV